MHLSGRAGVSWLSVERSNRSETGRFLVGLKSAYMAEMLAGPEVVIPISWRKTFFALRCWRAARRSAQGVFAKMSGDVQWIIRERPIDSYRRCFYPSISFTGSLFSANRIGRFLHKAGVRIRS